MCFNYKVSLFTFAIGTLFSLLLIKHGNPAYALDNKILGTFLIFITSIQFMDFLFWIDLKNTLGLNKLMTIFGPILNIGQPTILYLINAYYRKRDILRVQNLSVSGPIALLNLCYVLYFVSTYLTYLSKEKLVTGTEHKHLKWPWIKYQRPVYYLLLLAINFFYIFPFSYALLIFSITYFFLFISWKYFYYNTGELWCFFGAFIPLIMYTLSLSI